MPFQHLDHGQGRRKPLFSSLALLLAGSIALTGCVSSKGKDPMADLLTPDAESIAAADDPAQQSPAKADPASPTAEYAAAPGQAPEGSQPGAAANQDRPDMAASVMQATGINANRSSIFASAPQPTAIAPGEAPVEQASGATGFNATNASFFSASGKNPLLASADTGEIGSADDMEADDVPLILRGKLYSSRDLGPDPNDTATDMVTMASLPSMTRQSVTGLLVQNPSVQTSCFKPQLLNMLHEAEAHFGKRIVVTSGFRDPEHNARVGGAKRSQHLHCNAADIQMVGVSKWDLARYFRGRPDIGGVGTYCSTNSIHVDIGPRRDWNWKCRPDTEL